MIRGFRYRYVLVRDLFARDPEVITQAFRRYFGEIGLYEARMKFFRTQREEFIIRVTLERLDDLLSVLAILRGYVILRISGTLKKLRELGREVQDTRGSGRKAS